MRITDLVWDDANVRHLWAAHQVTPDDVEEIIFGIDGEPARFRVVRDGVNYKISGETGGGRLLLVVGTFAHDGRFRAFAARDMGDLEKRTYRKR